MNSRSGYALCKACTYNHDIVGISFKLHLACNSSSWWCRNRQQATSNKQQQSRPSTFGSYLYFTYPSHPPKPGYHTPTPTYTSTSLCAALAIHHTLYAYLHTMATSLAVPVAYITVLVTALAIFSRVYRRRKIGKSSAGTKGSHPPTLSLSLYDTDTWC